MADSEQSSEFLGGGPKFNAVGQDTRKPGSVEEPVIPVRRTGYRLQIAAAVVIIVLLAMFLFYINDNTPGKISVAPTHSGRSVSPDTAQPTSDPNLK